jgi:tRNA dimethylallyltransferase
LTTLTIFSLTGPTASGKTAVGVALAERLGAEVVAMDSMTLYRGMDVGTAKPTAAERAEVPHHLLDIVDVEDEFSVAEFQRAARDALADIERRGRRALLVGGTGLYVRAVVDGLELPGQFPAARAEVAAEPDTAALHARLAALDPLAASRTTSSNRRRIERALEVTIGSGRPFSSFGPGLDAYPPVPIVQVAVDVPLDDLDRRIADRVDAMVAGGLLDEAAALLGRDLSRTAARVLGYEEAMAHLRGELALEEVVAATVHRTRRLARRQLRWFRRDPRVAWREIHAAGDLVMAALGAPARR